MKNISEMKTVGTLVQLYRILGKTRSYSIQRPILVRQFPDDAPVFIPSGRKFR